MEPYFPFRNIGPTCLYHGGPIEECACWCAFHEQPFAVCGCDDEKLEAYEWWFACTVCGEPAGQGEVCERHLAREFPEDA